MVEYVSFRFCYGAAAIVEGIVEYRDRKKKSEREKECKSTSDIKVFEYDEKIQRSTKR